MIYETRLTVPKNTAESSAVSVDMPINPGVITRVEVTYPPGPAGLTHAQVWLWERQLWPANPDSDFAGDDIQITFDEDLEIVDPPYILTLKGWNEDDTYPHTITLRVQITPTDQTLRSAIERLALGGAGPITFMEG